MFVLEESLRYVQSPLLLHECEAWEWHTGLAEEQSSYDNEVGVDVQADIIGNLSRSLGKAYLWSDVGLQGKQRGAWALCYWNGCRDASVGSEGKNASELLMTALTQIWLQSIIMKAIQAFAFPY